MILFSKSRLLKEISVAPNKTLISPHRNFLFYLTQLCLFKKVVVVVVVVVVTVVTTTKKCMHTTG